MAQTGAMQVLPFRGAAQPNFYVLYAHGREEIVKYALAMDGTLNSEVVLQFPPSYGSCSVSLLDWNQDGRDDLLYTCGDGADYISAPKPYHGVRVFVAQADGSFLEELFLPLPGAYGAAAADFDGDGA